MLCIDCHEDKPEQTQGGTGFATTDAGPVCYACMGIRDNSAMRYADKGKRFAGVTLYLSKLAEAAAPFDWQVNNWPGSIQGIKVIDIVAHRHNMAGHQYHVLFRLGTHYFSGTVYGENTQVIANVWKLKS
jgi:hypothetical protein